jgi:hypothetical protein
MAGAQSVRTPFNAMVFDHYRPGIRWGVNDRIVHAD